VPAGALSVQIALTPREAHGRGELAAKVGKRASLRFRDQDGVLHKPSPIANPKPVGDGNEPLDGVVRVAVTSHDKVTA
jgi:hypothetical protein